MSRLRRFTIRLILAVPFLASGAPALAQCERARIDDPAASSSTLFGEAFDFAGGLLAVGDEYESTDVFRGGAVYLFGGDNWQAQIGTLRAPSPEAQAHFGNAIATDGHTIAIAAKDEDRAGVDAGVVYVFEVSDRGPVLAHTLVADDAMPYDRFGTTLMLDGDTLAVGQHNDQGAGRHGAVYVYRRVPGGWRLEAKLDEPVATPGGDFARGSIALDGDTLVVGAERAAGAGFATGAAHVFVRAAGVWSFDATLSPSDGGLQDAFGSGVDVDGDRIVVGAPLHAITNAGDGAAYVFERGADDGWSEVAKLWTPGFQPIKPFIGRSLFGRAVALDGERLWVGAPSEDEGAGALFAYDQRGSNWLLASRYGDPLPTGAPPSEWLLMGVRLRIDGGIVATEAGFSAPRSVRLIESAFTAYGEALPATHPDLYGTSCPELGATLDLRVARGPANASGVIVFGFERAATPTPFGPLLVDPIFAHVPVTLDGGGAFELSVPLTNSALAGLELRAQALLFAMGPTHAVEFRLEPGATRSAPMQRRLRAR